MATWKMVRNTSVLKLRKEQMKKIKDSFCSLTCADCGIVWNKEIPFSLPCWLYPDSGVLSVTMACDTCLKR